jgi:hypothetical protein
VPGPHASAPPLSHCSPVSTPPHDPPSPCLCRSRVARQRVGTHRLPSGSLLPWTVHQTPPPPLLSRIWMSNARPLAPLCFSIGAARAPPLPIPAPVLLLSFEVAPRVTSSLLIAGSPSPSAEGPLCTRIMQRSHHRPSHGEHHHRPCHFCAFFKFFPP